MNQMSKGLRVHKTSASRIISYLKDHELLDNSKKIEQINDHVLIPIQNQSFESISESLGIEFEIIEYQFEAREYKPASLKEALQHLIPEISDDDYQTSFDQIGHIAVIDLNYALEAVAEKVGKAIMWANPSITTVYQKSTKVEGEFRLRGLELIAGEDHPRTLHKEHGINIMVDVRKAYFSPRLATEHDRIASMIDDNSTVLDMFGSLAPFALHIAKNTSAEITTVDINPNVVELIEISINKNKLEGGISVVTSDAREYIESIDTQFDYIIMNHPSGAYDFLDVAISALKEGGKIFYYDFIEIEDYTIKLGGKLSSFPITIDDIHIVRQSSPSEYHICATLTRSSL